MTTGRSIAYAYINKLWTATFITSEEGADLASLHCQGCGQNFFTPSDDTTMKDIRLATLNHLQQEHAVTWNNLVAAGDACLEAATAAWNAGEDFLGVENLFDCADNLRNLFIVCPVEECCKWFNHKISTHAQLGPGNLDISDELKHYFITRLANHYMETHRIHDLPIPTND